MKPNTMTILGIGATVAGMALSVLSGWISNKKMDETISNKVKEALDKNK